MCIQIKYEAIYLFLNFVNFYTFLCVHVNEILPREEIKCIQQPYSTKETEIILFTIAWLVNYGFVYVQRTFPATYKLKLAEN